MFDNFDIDIFPDYIDDESYIQQYYFNLIKRYLHSEYDVTDLTSKISMMMELGANIQKLDDDGKTLLHHAASSTNSEISEIIDFLQEHIDVNSQDNDGNTPLMIAVKNKNYKAVTKLFEEGASPEIKNKYLSSPFLESIKLNCTYYVKLFIDDVCLEEKQSALIESIRDVSVSTGVFQAISYSVHLPDTLREDELLGELDEEDIF